ncbi:MAG: hypothetical protein WA655_04615, partial [Candidatus Korobacteraceae bacterium]
MQSRSAPASSSLVPGGIRPPASWLRRHWDVIGVLLLVIAAIPAAWVLPKTLVLVPSPGFMDDDWHLDAAFKASRGIWIGRDVAFTHGPLFQWLSSLPARSAGVSTGVIYATWNTAPMGCAIVLVWLTLWLLVPEQPPWKRFLLLLLLCVFWSPSLRISSAILLFAVFLRGVYAVAAGRLNSLAAGAVAALLCAVAFLMSGDAGVYGLTALVTALVGVAIEYRRDRRAVMRIGFALAAAVGSSALLMIVINAAMARPFDFQFWRDTFAMVSAYRWATPSSMTQMGAARLLATLLCGAVIFVVQAVVKSAGAMGTTKRSGFLIGGAAFCGVLMQSALVRSDEHHIGASLLATVFLSSAILFSFEARPASAIGVLVFVGCSLLFGEVRSGSAAPIKFEEVAFAPAIGRHLVAQLRNPLTECPPGFGEFDRACFPEEFSGMLRTAAAFLQEHAGPQDSIAIFPYQTRYGLAARRNVAGGMLQAYIATGAYLSQREIAGLERAAPSTGLYLPDVDPAQLSSTERARWFNSDLSLPVDGVTNFTRVPEVWLWMQRHYRTQQQISTGIAGLLRDDARAGRILTYEQSLGLPARTYAIHNRNATLDLGAPAWPVGADFLRLRLTVHYPIWWKLRKPERIQLEIVRADGSRELQWFVLPPGISSEVW